MSAGITLGILDKLDAKIDSLLSGFCDQAINDEDLKKIHDHTLELAKELTPEGCREEARRAINDDAILILRRKLLTPNPFDTQPFSLTSLLDQKEATQQTQAKEMGIRVKIEDGEGETVLTGHLDVIPKENEVISILFEDKKQIDGVVKSVTHKIIECAGSIEQWVIIGMY